MFKPTQDEKNAQEVLARLGFKCESQKLVNREGYAHSISEAETGQLRWASVHPDIFLSMAITSTLKMLADTSAKASIRRLKYTSLGMCPGHPSVPIVPGKRSCRKCLDNQKARYAAAKPAGMCTGHTSIPALPGRACCQRCLDNARARYAAAKASGICWRCRSAPVAEGSKTSCQRCKDARKSDRKGV